MRVATFNARHGRPWRGFTSNAWLAKSIRRLDADVLTVQEVERRVIRSWFADQPALVAAAAGVGAEGTGYVYAPARRLAVFGSDGVVLAVRGRVERQEIVRLAGRNGRQDRVAIVATVDTCGTRATVMATHLQNDPADATAQLDELLSIAAGGDGPRILLGDLNLPTAEAAPACARAGLTIVEGGPSAPAMRPLHRIDHVAVANLRVESAKVLQLPVSDHRAVVAELGSPST